MRWIFFGNFIVGFVIGSWEMGIIMKADGLEL